MDTHVTNTPYARHMRRLMRSSVGAEEEERSGEGVRVVALSMRQRQYLAELLDGVQHPVAEGLKLVLDLEDIEPTNPGNDRQTGAAETSVNTVATKAQQGGAL